MAGLFEELVDLVLSPGRDCSEGLPLDKMVGFVWSPWIGPQDVAGIRGAGSATQVGGPDRSVPPWQAVGGQVSVVRDGVLALPVKSGGNRIRGSPGLQQAAPPSSFLKTTKLV